ncbi:MAG: hypothetical protein D6785_02115 [Planctomycetota bacterium]|nr:MAG: hypothetical protein D6785_02115 [Planctomycetota bacterium]
MKKLIVLCCFVGLALLFAPGCKKKSVAPAPKGSGTGTATGTSAGKGTGTHKHVAKGYMCPMKCEGDKTYDKPGKCPKCGMKLKPVNEVLKKDEHKDHDHK